MTETAPHPFCEETLKVMQCMFLLSPDGMGVDLQEADELLRLKWNLTEDQADEWWLIAARDGVIEVGPARQVS